MKYIDEIFSNGPFVAALIAWFLAQGFKILTTWAKLKRFDPERIMGSGGMPSSHTASIVSATVQIGKIYGFSNPLFGFGMVISFITMYDAANVRMAAGQQAKVIKQIVDQLGRSNFKIEKELKELLGHTYLEVFVGMLLGIAIGLLY